MDLTPKRNDGRPLSKFEQRVKQWADMQLGLALDVIAFNVYIVTVLEFAAQLYEVDDDVTAATSWALRVLAIGPGNWVTQHDLENLTFFGFKQEFRTLEATAKAAKLLVVNEIALEVRRSESQAGGRVVETVWILAPTFTIQNPSRHQIGCS